MAFIQETTSAIHAGTQRPFARMFAPWQIQEELINYSKKL